MDFQPFHTYLQQLSAALKAGNATEHTHRPALKALVEALDATVTATNEPKRIACGAPDYIVTHGDLPLGYIEAKDVGADLDAVEASEQMQRYRAGFANLLLTDYLEFRWYVGGERRLTARLTDSINSPPLQGGVARSAGVVHALKWTPAAVESVAELLTHFLTATAPLIATPRELALRLAARARLLRGLVQRALAEEPAEGSLHGQWQAIQAVLLPQLTVEQFSDLYAQTLCYGLFTARCHAKPGAHFTRQHVAYDLPRTHPFLRTLFNHIAGPELNED
ncbi:MAG: methyltransferase, partial [Proteobacteria bacterium]|nr:methyltransferase [Pseudomonadota bacterium]